MKTLALLLLIGSAILMIPIGFMGLFTFGMSFDAPNSEADSKAWIARIGIFLVVALFGALVYFGYQAYQVENYQKTILFTAPVVVAFVGFIAWSYT
jgi:hypothetical protein